MTFELFLLSLTFGLSAGLVVWMLISSLKEVQAEAQEQLEVYTTNPLYRGTLPFIQHMGRQLESMRALEGFRKRISKRLMHAGKTLAITPDEFMGYMMVWGSIGAVVALYFWAMIPEYMSLFLTMKLILLCAFIPYIQLRDMMLRRQKAIRKTLPYALDLLCLAVEAGLDFTAALNRIGENLKNNPFQEELRMLTRDLNMGKTRPEALRDMDKRIGIEELTSVVSALVQADELGASLGPALRIQSEELQRVRFQKAEKKAMQAPVLMLIPLVLFIFPLVFMIIFTPIAIQVMQTL